MVPQAALAVALDEVTPVGLPPQVGVVVAAKLHALVTGRPDTPATRPVDAAGQAVAPVRGHAVVPNTMVEGPGAAVRPGEAVAVQVTRQAVVPPVATKDSDLRPPSNTDFFSATTQDGQGSRGSRTYSRHGSPYSTSRKGGCRYTSSRTSSSSSRWGPYRRTGWGYGGGPTCAETARHGCGGPTTGRGSRTSSTGGTCLGYTTTCHTTRSGQTHGRTGGNSRRC